MKKEEQKFSPGEVAASGMLGMSARHIRRLCESGDLDAIDVGTGSRHWWKISESSLRKFIKNGGRKR